MAAYKTNTLRQIAIAIGVLILAFTGTQIAYGATNSHVYGKYVGVDFKESNFQAALRALQSVRSGGVKDFVAITQAARERIYRVSPNFASLRRHLDGKASDGWRDITCKVYPSACGEIAAGWFAWDLRDAAAETGHYVSPKEASAFFRRVTREVKAACKDGRLECQAQLILFMPPVSSQQLISGLPQRYLAAADLLLNPRPSNQFEPSTGLPEPFQADLRFLNYPTHTHSIRVPDQSVIYTFGGTYYRSGSDWFSVGVTDAKGAPIDLRIVRSASPNLAQRKQDPAAGLQQFNIEVACNERCLLQLRTSDRSEGHIAFDEAGQTPFAIEIGPGQFSFDSIQTRPNPSYSITRVQTMALKLREFVLTNYRGVAQPIYAIGLLAFLLSLVHWRKLVWNDCFVLALAAWTLVLSRVSLLALIDVTSFPSLNWLYLTTGFYALTSAVIFSSGAFAQLGCQADKVHERTKRE